MQEVAIEAVWILLAVVVGAMAGATAGAFLTQALLGRVYWREMFQGVLFGLATGLVYVFFLSIFRLNGFSL